LKQIVLDATARYESTMPKPWTIPLSEEEIDAMFKAIVGFQNRYRARAGEVQARPEPFA